MKTTYSPGLWTHETEYISAERKAKTGDSIIREGKEAIARCRSDRATLIAAAPDLLAELRHTADNLHSMIRIMPVSVDPVVAEKLLTWLSRTELVIAKAKGRQ